MDKNNHSPFTPEQIDTQINQLADRASTLPETVLVDDLLHMYLDDERSLENVWQRLGLQGDVPTRVKRSSAPLYLVPSETQLPADGGIPDIMSARTRQTGRHSISHALSLVAAILVAALIVGSMLVVFTLARQSTQTVSSPSPTTGIYLASWDTMYKLDTQTRHVIWQRTLKTVVKIIPAGNTVYLLQGDVDTAGESAVLALDVKSGKTLWQRHFTLQTSDLALFQNLLYVSVENVNAPIGAKDAGQIYVLNAQNGSLHKLYPPIDSAWSLVVSDGVLGVNTDSGLRVYDAASGKQLWQAAINAPSRPRLGGMSIVDGLLYASVGGSYITAYKARTGQHVWQSPNFNNISAFTVDHNFVYFGTSFDSLQQGVPLKGTAYAYDVQHNKRLWGRNVDGGVVQAPVVGDGMVYVAADGGSHSQAHIAALTAATGAIKWQKLLANNITESFSLSNNSVLYVGNSSDFDHPPAPDSVDALRPADGSKLWVETRFGAADAMVVIN